MFHFSQNWFALLFPLPFVIRWLFPAAEKRGVLKLYFPSLHRLKKAFPAFSGAAKVSNLPFLVLFSLTWIFLVIALMQPERVDQYQFVNQKGYDLMLAVDISGSMQAVDFSTHSKTISRLDVAKDVVGKFVLQRQGDRVGLIAFGENAYLHVPLTFDTVSVSKMLSDTVPGMAGNGTAIGDAIGLAVRILRERPEGSRVLVLLTDGEDNSSSLPPLEAAKLAKQYGIRIYTVGVGRNGMVPVPMQGGGYGMAQVSIDEELLKEIAALTEGKYFLAQDQKTLEKIYAKINELEPTESHQVEFLIRDPLYPYPLGAAMGFFLVLIFWRFAHD